jgi:hypothetical protein
VRFHHWKHPTNKHRISKDEQERPANKRPLPPRQKVQVQDISHQYSRSELTEIVPQGGKTSCSQIKEIPIEIVGLVGHIPKTRKSIREEQDDEGLSFDCQREIFQLLPHGSLARDENSRAIIPENGFGFGDKECNDTAHQHQDEESDIRPIIRAPSCGDAPILRGRNDSSYDGDEERQTIENRNVFPFILFQGQRHDHGALS